MESARLKRIVNVLAYLAREADGRSLSEISRDLDLPVSSAHDLLRGLAEAGAVRVVDKRYLIGPVALRLGAQIVDGVGVRHVARPHLVELVERIGHDVYLAVASGGRPMYLDRFPGRLALKLDIRLGQPLYLHSTAVGKLFAALDPEARKTLQRSTLPALTPTTITDRSKLARELELIRRHGVSLSRGESVEGVVGMAAPVRGGDGRLCAAIHVSALRPQLPPERRRAVAAAMRAAAVAVERDLGAAAPVPAAA